MQLSNDVMKGPSDVLLKACSNTDVGFSLLAKELASDCLSRDAEVLGYVISHVSENMFLFSLV